MDMNYRGDAFSSLAAILMWGVIRAPDTPSRRPPARAGGDGLVALGVSAPQHLEPMPVGTYDVPVTRHRRILEAPTSVSS
jgi:hypothetical protein